MNCSSCGIALQAEVANCPSCGSPTSDARQVAPQYNPAPGTPQGLREAAAQNIFPPLSLRQSAKQPATHGSAAPQQAANKLSDYADQSPTHPSKLSDFQQPTAPRGKLPDNKQSTAAHSKLSDFQQPTAAHSKLSDFQQPTAAHSKLSDNKQPTAPRSKLPDNKQSTAAHSKLSDYKSTTTPASNSSPAHTPLSDVRAISLEPSLSHPSNPQVVYPGARNPANSSGVINPSSPVPSTTYQGYEPSLQVGKPPAHRARSGKQNILLRGGIAIILLIVCIGAVSIFLAQKTHKGKEVVSRPKVLVTPVPTVTPVRGPSGNTSVPAISAMFSELRMAGVLDDNNRARQVTESFSSKQTIYVTFTLDSKNQNGYVQARWYKGKQLFKEVIFAHDARRSNGYFSIVYDGLTTAGSVEIYWSTTANFSDAKLARVAHFTVNA